MPIQSAAGEGGDVAVDVRSTMNQGKSFLRKGICTVNTIIKRMSAALLALMLLVSLLGPGTVTARAEEGDEYIYTNPYVIQLFPEDQALQALASQYDYADYLYVWGTPHEMKWTYTNLASGASVTRTDDPGMMQMINTVKVAAGPQEGEAGTPYASIGAYCTDASVYTSDNAYYRRVNLEDCTYYDDETSGKIRAICLSSFPYIQDMSQVEAAVNAWLAATQTEYTPVSGLTGAEALLATQAAIWTQANQDTFQLLDCYTGTADLSGSAASIRDMVIYCDEKDGANIFESARATTENNVEQLYAYLCALEPMAPREVTVSDGSLQAQDLDIQAQEDGTYNVTVTFTTSAAVEAGDDLTVTATLGDQRQSFALTAENVGSTHTVTFTGVAKPEDVKVEINGTQTAADVFLFDSEGDRLASQSLVAYDNSTMPVHGEITVGVDRIVNIYKTTGEDEGKTPLANISFSIYQVAAMADIENGTVVLSQQPTAEELAQYQVEERLVTTLTTDAGGFATYNFTENGQPDGVYLVVEQPNDAVTAPVDPFYVAVPGTAADGDGWEYTVNIYPKNDVETGPEVDKDVTSIGQESDTADVGDAITWIIRGGVPQGIASGIRYTITDTLDDRLTYTSGSVVVKLYTKAGTEVELTKDTHYTVAETTAQDQAGNTVDQFTVSLTAEGMAWVAQNLGDGDKTPEIRVYFQTVLNEHAGLGEEIPNQAKLEYENATGMDFEDESDQPEVHTGGLNLRKVDASTGTPLSGAAFQIARDASRAELADESVAKETLVVNGVEHTVVFVDFYPTQTLSGEKVYEAASGSDGTIRMYGLAYGTYYLVETKAPADYNLLSAPVEVTINASSHLDTSVVTVKNSKFLLPETGGMGTTLFTVAGLVTIGGASVLLLASRKKKEAE